MEPGSEINLMGEGFRGNQYVIGACQKNIGIYLRDDLLDGQRFDEQTERAAINLVFRAADYMVDLMPDQEYLADNYVISLVETGWIRGLGNEIRIPQDYLKEKFIGTEEDGYDQNLMISLAVHELAHGLTNLEDLPMLGEMIYMLENEGEKRIEQIAGFYKSGELEEKHMTAVKVLTLRLGYETAEDMFTNLPNRQVDDLKVVFRQMAKEYWEED